MTPDQDPKLEIIPSQHPVDAIVRAIVAGAEFARRVFDQTKDYEMPPDKEDRENFAVLLVGDRYVHWGDSAPSW